MRKIRIFDTTLRDGEQSPGCSMNQSEKLELARQLDKLGVDAIEAGFAACSEEDFSAVAEIAAEVKNAAVVSLARANENDIKLAAEAVSAAAHPMIHVFIATSDVHLKYKLEMTRKQVLELAASSVACARSLCAEVEFSAEDATRSDRVYLAEVYTAAIKAGATVINVPDTVGYSTPDEMMDLIKYLKANVEGIENVCVSVHCHNDLGLAVANSLAGVLAGASQVECTVNGIGERAGNASLDEIVMGIKTRTDFYNCETDIVTRRIYRTARLLTSITGIPIHPTKPVVGANAFAHEAGIHQHGVMRERSTYEIMSGAEVGIPQTKIVLGKHSGKHAFRERLELLGYDLSDDALNEAFTRFKELADKKKDITNEDIEALVSQQKTFVSEVYSLESFVVNSGTKISAMATVSLRNAEGQIVNSVGQGTGPIDAAFNAINLITRNDIKLLNYSIQSVTEGEDALGEVVVKLEVSGDTVTGRGLSTDIIESSIKAYLNGINKAYALGI